MYETQQNKKEAAIKAQKDLQLNKLKNASLSHKETTDSLLSEIQNKLEPELNQAKEKAFDKASTDEYINLQNKLSDISKALTQNTLLASSDTPTEESLSQLEAVNYAQTQAIENLRSKLSTQQLSDVIKECQKILKQINSTYDKAASLTQEYNSIKEQTSSRLSQIVTEFDPAKDSKISTLEEQIAPLLNKFKSQNSPLLDKFSFMTSRSDIKQVEEYKLELNELLTQTTSDANNLQKYITEYISYISEQTAQQEQNYSDKLRAEEVERKIEENTGYINIKKSGKTVTVSRNIEEIEKAEEMASEAEVKVLDFSKPKTTPPTQAPQKNIVKKGRLTIK